MARKGKKFAGHHWSTNVALSAAVALSTAWIMLPRLTAQSGTCGVVLDSASEPLLIELDRNAQAGNCRDWNQVYVDSQAGNTATSGADAVAFTHEISGGSTYTGGSTKDFIDLPSWKWTAGSVPPKDQLLDAFAARYGNMLYFGSDRTANNGDSQMGFWFFQNPVTPLPGGSFGGTHKNGDVLVLSDFVNGGATTVIRVFRWHSPGGSSLGTLDLIAGGTTSPADCVGPPAVSNGSPFCATVNNTTQTAPWPFTPKVGTSGSFASGEFYEGGIDLSFLSLGSECFSSFIAETRSSASVDAVLKDFVAGGFQHCGSSVVTTPRNASNTATAQINLGDSISDYALITGTGGASTAPTGNMAFFVCTPAEVTANGGTCSGTTGTQKGGLKSVTQIGSTTNSEAQSDSFIPDVTGKWCWRGEYSGDSIYPGASDASTGECFTVVSVQAHIGTAQIWSVFDTATVTVDPAGGSVLGTVRYDLYAVDCSGSPIMSSTKSISGTSPATAPASDTYPASGGVASNTYKWIVTYTPDATRPAQVAATSTCGNENTVIAISNGVTQP